MADQQGLEVLDPSQFQEVAPVGTGPAAAAAPQFEDITHAVEEIPDHSNGVSPNTPINQSTLSATDRLKMSLGNEKGNMQYLMSKSDIAAVQMDPTGHFVYQDANTKLWHRADPSGGGDGDAWSRTKEIMKDAAEMAPSAVKTLGAIGAGVAAAPLTGGLGSAAAGAVMGAGLEGYRTSLGRLVGTYQASPDEQMKDLGFEALLNLGGSAIGAGTKPVANVIGKAAKGIGQALERVAPATANAAKEAISTTIGAVSGVGQKAVRTALDYGENVSASLGAALRGRSREKAVDFLKNESIGTVKEIAKKAQPALNNIYTSLKNDMMETAGESFKGDVDQVLRSAWSDALQADIGQVIKDGKVVDITPQELLKNGLPKGSQFGLKTMEALQSSQRQTGNINPIANDPESYKLIEQLHQTLKNFANMGEQTGKRGLHNMLEMKKVIGDTAFKLGSAADEQGLNVAKRYIAQVESHTENQMLSSMKPEVQKAYTNLMSSYSNAKEQMAPLINALSTARNRGDAVFEPLLNKLASRPGSNAAIKDQFSNAIDLIASKGDPGVKDLMTKIDVHDAAAQFIPIFRKGIAGAIGVPAATGAAIASGNPAIAAGVGAAGLATSPRAALGAIRGGQMAASATGINLAVKSMFSLKDMVSNLDPNARNKLIQSPQLINGLFQAVARTPEAANAVSGMLVEHGLNQAAPTPLPPQGQEGQ